MTPKFRFYPNEESETPTQSMYNVVEIRFDESIVVIEDDKNTSMLEVVEEDYHTSANGLPTFCYHYDEGDLMMASGVNDMDGTEIYEGDIIGLFYEKRGEVKVNVFGVDTLMEIGEKTGRTDYDLGVVEYQNGCFVVYPQGVMTYSYLFNIAPKWCKVVGNRFENPELLNGDNNDRTHTDIG